MKKKSFLTLFIVLFLVMLTGCESSATTSGTQNTEQPVVTKKTYGLKEDIYITNDSGEYRLKITGVKETADRNEFSDIVAERVVIISYEYENISLNDDLYISDYDFKVYDADNNSLDDYPIYDIDYSDSVSVGRKSSGEMAFALNNSRNYLELEYYDNMWNSSSDCIIKLEW